MQNYSKTYVGVIVMAIGYVFTTAGVPFVEGDLQTTIATLISFCGAIVTLYGRYKAGGVSALGFRISK